MFQKALNEFRKLFFVVFFFSLLFVRGYAQTDETPLEIKEVKVDGSEKFVDIQFDRLIFYMNDRRIAATTTFLELVETFPGIHVQSDRTISYKGASVVIFIDDQPGEYLYPDWELIPVSGIYKIELIDAAFKSGSGTDAIINIGMKKNKSKGANGIFSTHAASGFSELNAGTAYGNLNIVSKKYSFFTTINYQFQNMQIKKNQTGSSMFNLIDYGISNSSVTMQQQHVPSVSTGFVVHSNEKTNITVAANVASKVGNQNQIFSHQQMKQNQTMYDQYENNFENSFSKLQSSLNILYHKKINKQGRELTVGTGFRNFTENDESHLKYKYLMLSNIKSDSTYSENIQSDFSKVEWFTSFYYNFPLKYQWRWNAGFNSNIVFPHLAQHNALVNEKANNLQSNSEYSNSRKFAFFGRLGKEFGNFTVDVGGAIQYHVFDTDFTRYLNDSIFKIKGVNKMFANLIPSAVAAYSIDSAHQIKFTFDRKIVNPQMFQLFRFTDKPNQRIFYSGDTALMDLDYNNFNLSYISSTENLHFSAGIFYQIINDEIANIMFPKSDIISVIIPHNLPKQTKAGIDISAWLGFFKKIEFNVATEIFRSTMKPLDSKDFIVIGKLDYNNMERNKFGISCKINTNFKITSSTFGMLYLNYVSPEMCFEGSMPGYILSSFGVTQKLANKKFLISIGVNNVLNDLIKQESSFDYFGFKSNVIESGTQYNRMIFFKIQYNLNQKEKSTKK